jgi:hypothetical protein
MNQGNDYVPKTPKPQYNGRVPLDGGAKQGDYKMSQDVKKTAYNMEALRTSNRDEDAVSQLFFSQKNINALQQGIRYMVFKKTCGRFTIDNQSENELKQIMRAMYLEHCRHLPFEVVEQVRTLNAYVIDYAVPRITGELELYMTYRKDISSLPVPLERAQNTSVAGTKTLEMKQF